MIAAYDSAVLLPAWMLNFTVAAFVQSTIVIGVGLILAGWRRRRDVVTGSIILRSTVIASILCPALLCVMRRSETWALPLHLPVRAHTGQIVGVFVGAAWAGVALTMIARIMHALRSLSRLRREARSASYQWIEDAGRCARAVGTPTPSVLQTDRVVSPCLAGYKRPTILLPAGQVQTRHDILLHEMAHVRRHDCLWHLLAYVATAMLWFQPLVWVLTRRLISTADEACDDIVLAYGSNRSDYARVLVELAEQHTEPLHGRTLAVGMVHWKSTLSRRVVNIMDTSRDVVIDVRRFAAATGIVFLAAVSILAAMVATGITVAADPAPPTSARAPIPDAATQSKTEKIVRDVFGNYAAAPMANRSAIAAKMLEQGIATADDPAARYVLLKDGIELAAGAGDATTAMRGASAIAGFYTIDEGELKLSLLRRAVIAATTPNLASAVAAEGLTCANDAATAGNYDQANRFMQPAEQAARASKNVTLILSVQTRASDIKWLQQESARAKTALEKLTKTPADPDANHALGRYFCLVRGDWSKGMIGLTKGSNAAWHAAAATDLANPTTSDKQVSAGDLWWDLAEKETAAVAQRALRRRAGYWYSQAAANPQFAGLKRSLVEKRLGQIPPPGPGEAVAEVASNLPPVRVPAAPPVPVQPISGNILKMMEVHGKATTLPDGSVRISEGSLQSLKNYIVPFRADFVAKTDSTNIRISFGKGQLIFNWEDHQDIAPLCFSDPAKGPGRVLRINGKGHVPVDKFVQISWIIDEHSTRILVDGEERMQVDGDYAGLSAPLAIYPQMGSVVTVSSLSVTEGASVGNPPAVVQAPPVVGTGPAATWTPLPADRIPPGLVIADIGEGEIEADYVKFLSKAKADTTFHGHSVSLVQANAEGVFRGPGPKNIETNYYAFFVRNKAQEAATLSLRTSEFGAVTVYLDGNKLLAHREDNHNKFDTRLPLNLAAGDHVIVIRHHNGWAANWIGVKLEGNNLQTLQATSAQPPPVGGNIFTDGPAPAAPKDAQTFARQRNALPPAQQIAATLAKLKEANGGGELRADIRPDGDGTLRVDITNQDALVNIEPLYGLRVSKLNLDTCRNLKSLNGVQGMPLTELNLTNCFALDGDLTALKGMRLTKFNLRYCKSLKSLNGIQGMPLTELNLYDCEELEGDLSALKGMRLTQIYLGNCKHLESLNGIQGMPLTELDLSNCAALEGDLSALKGMKLKHLVLFGCQHLESLSGIEGMPLTGELIIGHAHALSGDLSALRGMQLTKLDLYECFKLKSLNGIQNMPLKELKLTDCYALEGDLSALKGMPLTNLNMWQCRNVTSLDGLENAPLKELVLPRPLGRKYLKTILQMFPTLKSVDMGDQQMTEEVTAEIKARKGAQLPAGASPDHAQKPGIGGSIFGDTGAAKK